MKSIRLASLALAFTSLVACGDDDDTPAIDAGVDGAVDTFTNVKCEDIEDSETCVEIAGGDVEGLQEAANSLGDDTTIVLGKGTFAMTNSLTIRSDGAHIVGQGISDTILDFGPTTTQVNGVDVISNDFLVQDLTVLDAPKDGIRVEASDGVVFRRIRATWTNVGDPTNGAYGIYPVKSKNVLVEASFAENASDAGLYVGQCENVIVRGNTVTGNVAGLEIENTQYADVYENTAENNTGGIVVFDLPGNPIIGRDVRLFDNVIKNNNLENFAPGGTVAEIPAGTGTFAMASRRVEISNNTYEGNDTVDIAIINGLVIEGEVASWELDTATLDGKWDDLGLLEGSTEGTVTNFRSENIVISGNTHTGSGTSPDTSDPNSLGLLLTIIYGEDPVSNVLYDTVGEPGFDAADAALNTNVNHICVGGNTAGTFGSMNLEAQQQSPGQPFFRPAAPFVPFDCTELAGGPIVEVVLP